MARQIKDMLGQATTAASPAHRRRRNQSRFGIAAALIVLALSALPSPAPAADERFEVTSIKAVRPTLADTVAALEQRNVAAARAAFDAYDSAWNGVEVYISTRSKEMYDVIEHNYQAKVTKGLEAAEPDTAAVLADAKIMLAKFDEAIGLVSKAQPLNPLYDDVARLRIVRAHLREVVPALKAGNIAKARKSFMAFDENWDSIEDLIKARSSDNYVAVEKGMIEIEQALMPDKPDVAKVSALVNEVMAKYNASLADVMKEARSKQ
jgi:hypothetical protein